jgi:thioredoxin reductase (NADPH)
MSDASDSDDTAGDGAVERRRLVIAGSGIAGLTAAIYAARSNNDPLVLEGDEPGGQLTLTTEVDNYPGFPEGISGPELIQNMKDQATRFGAEIRHGIVEDLTVPEGRAAGESTEPFRLHLSNGTRIDADAVIAASGASARTLGVPGEETMMGYGLSTCATCDGAFFRGQDMLVVGGGDAAFEEANFLTKFADTVYLAHRREEFRAEDYWIDRVMEKVEDGAIELMRNTELVEIHGTREDGVDHVTLVRHPDGHPKEKLDDPATADEVERFDFDVSAVFYAIGHTPNTEYLAGTGVRMDDEGYIETAGGRGAGQTATDVPGIFGAGDVVDFHYQQAVTAGGMGAEAAIDADDYLEDLDRRRAREEAPDAGAVPAESDD